MKYNPNAPEEYQDYWFLGPFDMKPTRLGDTDIRLTRNECRSLRVHGWLFARELDARRVRNTMLTARLMETIRIKGYDGAIADVVFTLPVPTL